MTNYKSFASRIKKAKTISDTESLDKSLWRLYEAGIFTVNQCQRLDGILMDKEIEIINCQKKSDEQLPNPLR